MIEEVGGLDKARRLQRDMNPAPEMDIVPNE